MELAEVVCGVRYLLLKKKGEREKGGGRIFFFVEREQSEERKKEKKLKKRKNLSSLLLTFQGFQPSHLTISLMWSMYSCFSAVFHFIYIYLMCFEGEKGEREEGDNKSEFFFSKFFPRPPVSRLRPPKTQGEKKPREKNYSPSGLVSSNRR